MTADVTGYGDRGANDNDNRWGQRFEVKRNDTMLGMAGNGGTMRNAKHDDLVAQQTREYIAIRMESFAVEFKRLASTANLGALAERFSNAVHDVVSVPLTAADVQPLGEWLKGYGEQFEQLASTADQKELVASFKGFSADVTGPAIKELFQRPLVNELVEEMKSALADGHSNGIPIAWLSDADRKEYLGVVIDWTDYINRGLELEPDTAAHIERIIENAVARKPCKELIGLADLAQGFDDRLSRQSAQPAIAPEKDKDRGIDR